MRPAKPGDCAADCPYPDMIAKNGSGHASTCPVHQHWQDALGAGSVFSQDAQIELKPRTRPTLDVEAVTEITLHRRSADEVAFAAAQKITELETRIAQMYEAAGIPTGAPHEVAIHGLANDTRRTVTLRRLVEVWRYNAGQRVPGSEHYNAGRSDGINDTVEAFSQTLYELFP